MKLFQEVEGVLEEDEVGILAVLLGVAPGYGNQPLEKFGAYPLVDQSVTTCLHANVGFAMGQQVFDY